jgi:general secretion pathway protein B
MSYILDALRKSDQLRRRGAAPTLLLGETTATVPKRPAPLVYGLLGLVLLIAGFAIGWMHPWQRQPPATASPERMLKPPAPRESRVPAAGLAAAPQPQPQAQAQKPAPAVPVVTAPAEAHAPRRAKATRKSVRPKAVATASRKTAAKLPRPAPSSGAVAAAPAAQAPVAAMTELPLAIQQEMPTLNISVHAYSPKPADRLVDINGRLLHEGDTVAPGLTLERITPDGMILNYKGYTFHRGLR